MDAQENEERYPTDEIEILTNIKENLKFLRKKSKLSQKDFAKPLLVSDKVLSRYENDGKNDAKKVPPINVLFRVCNAYHVSIEDLLTRRLEDTPGITTTEHLLTEHEKQALNEALAQAMYHKEKIESFEFGILKVSAEKSRYEEDRYSFEIPFCDLQEILTNAKRSYQMSLNRQLRSALDIKRYRCIAADDAEISRRIAKIIDADFEEYAKKYELIWSPILRYCQMDTPEAAPNRHRDVYEKFWELYLPFRSIQNLLFIQYFTGNNPLAYIQDDLVEIHNRMAKGEVFSPIGLYKKMHIAIYGDGYTVNDPELCDHMMRYDKLCLSMKN